MPERQNSDLRRLITERKKAKNARDRQQPVLIENREVFKRTLESKLPGLFSGRQMENFLKCGREEIFSTCKNCGTFEKFYFACNRKWCPLCNWKISNQRAAHLRLWSQTIAQPKHLVLTMRNFPVLTRSKIRAFQKALLALRRTKLFEQVKGGCASLEITNEGNGWHLHAHCLLDCRWLPADQIAITWGKLIGQEFGIVKVKDVRGTDYVQEISKYVAKGSELAGWEPDLLLQFITAIKGCRFFCTFGSLRAKAKEIKRAVLALKGPGKVCACGCSQFIYETEASAILHDLRRQQRR